MMKNTKWSVLLLAIALGACGIDTADDEGVATDDAVTADDLAFYEPGPLDATDLDELATADTAEVAGDVPDAETAPRVAYASKREPRAVQWYKQHVGSKAYEGLCELAAEQSYGTRGRYRSAIANWNAQVAAHRAHKGDRHAPVGALVFWRTSANGHVAVSDGTGGEWSSSVNHRIGHAGSTTYFRNYLGWAYAPTSWPGR